MEGGKVAKEMRVMAENPLNAETPTVYLRSWITANSMFFDRNQNALMEVPIDLAGWGLTITGEVKKELQFTFDKILRMPKAIVANTLECSGNGRSLLKEKAKGNPWTIGGVGNAVWGGVWLKDVLQMAGLKESAKHVAFEGFDKPAGSAGIRFVRSIPIEKGISSTLLAYEMNGEPLPLKHGYPLRGLTLGWTGANCVKWLSKITLLERPFEGFFMDNVYRIFQKAQDPKTGEVVTRIPLKSIITQPLADEKLPAGPVIVLGAAYCGEAAIESVEVSVDGGQTWQHTSFIGPNELYAWRQWQYIWDARDPGIYTLMARATDSDGHQQSESARWNTLGYGNNGVQEHAVTMEIV
jgi:DMSO/TMAO reductase YedYZ molybdopterin-dependent catalytic subunit